MAFGKGLGWGCGLVLGGLLGLFAFIALLGVMSALLG